MLMLGKQLTAEQRLTKAVVTIMGNPKYVALAGVLMIGDRSIDETHPTASTNGRDERYGRAFVDSLNDAQLRFLVLHECYHKLYQHLTTWRWMYAENAELANIACDHVINLKIADDNKDGFAIMPTDKDGNRMGAYDERFRGMDSAQVYKLLKQEQGDDEGDDDGEDEGDGDDADEGTGISQRPNKSGKPDKPKQPQLDEHDWEGANQLTPEEKKDLARDIDEAIRQGALAAGKLGTGTDRDLHELLKAKIDWREVLREFVTTTCTGNDFSTWRRPNRRFVSSGVYLPSGITEQVGELVIAVDTSGSIGGAILSQFLGEIKGICDTVHPEAVRLLYWDTEVCRDEKYVGEDVEKIVDSTKPAGGGGTLVECVPDYLTEHAIKPQAVVVLTDGYLGGTWGSWNVPVLWCIVDNPQALAPVGKTVHIRD